MTQRRQITARSATERAQVAADVRVLMSALQAGASPRQSPVYRWLDEHHDELLASLGDRRVEWATFAAHLGTLGLTDGKGTVVTGSVARNTWHRVKTAHRASTRGNAEDAPSAGVPMPAHADQGGGGGAQDADGTRSPTAKNPAQDQDAGQSAPAPGGDGYPHGVRPLIVPEPAPAFVKESALAASDAAPPSSTPSKGHSASSDISWTAEFDDMPSHDVRDLLGKSGGRYNRELKRWSGVGHGDLSSLTDAVRKAGGLFQVSPGTQPMT